MSHTENPVQPGVTKSRAECIAAMRACDARRAAAQAIGRAMPVKRPAIMRRVKRR